jgi:hypothetical protein
MRRRGSAWPALLPQQLLSADARRERITPGRLDQHAPRDAIPDFRDAALATYGAAGALGRNKTEIRHELAGIGEAADVAEFGDQCRRRDKSHSAQRLQGAHHWGERPIRQRRLDMGLQTIASRRRRLDGCNAIFQDDMMRRLLESQSGHPPAMHQRPCWSMIAMTMTQQEAGELLTSLTQTATSRQTGAHEIADRLMGRIRNPDRRQFARPMQLGQVDRVPPVGLDPIARLARDQRRSHDDAIMPSEGQLPLNAIAARSGLVAERKRASATRQLRHQSAQGRRCVRDLAILAHVVPPARLSNRDRDRILVHVKVDICDRFFQTRLYA